jgi:hypothetical protein
MLTPQCPQQPQLVTLQAMNARRAVLGASDVDPSARPATADGLHDNSISRSVLCPQGRSFFVMCRALGNPKGTNIAERRLGDVL